MKPVDHIQHWIENTLSKSSPAFNELPPCPYAKQAWITGKVLVLENQEPYNFKELLQDYEVVIYAYNPTNITPDELYEKCTKITDDEIVALDDHPDAVEKVQDVVLNNGMYALILVQERHKLEQARKILKAKGYYNSWDPDYMQEVLGI